MLLIVISGLLFLFILAFFVFMVDGFFGKLDFVSNRRAAGQVAGIIKERHLEKGNFYDLGSARGNFAVKISTALPEMEITGIDDNAFRVLWSRARAVFLKNISFKKEDIFTANISSANIVYIYLPQELMPDLQLKLQKELKPGSLVITNKVSFPNWQFKQKSQELYIYQI